MSLITPTTHQSNVTNLDPSITENLSTFEQSQINSDFLSVPQTSTLQSNISLIVLPEARLNGIDKDTDPFISFIDKAKEEILMASNCKRRNYHSMIC